MQDLTSSEKGVVYLFEKSYVPMDRGLRGDGTFMYDTTEGLVTVRRRAHPLGPNVTTVKIDKMMEFADLPLSVLLIKRGKLFSQFLPSHMEAARELSLEFQKYNDINSLLNFAGNIRDVINEMLFTYCLAAFLMRKPQFRKIPVPSFVEVMPGSFISKPTLDKAMDEAANIKKMVSPPDRIVVEHDMDFSGNDLNLEHRVAYWREDYGINSHHWHWHLVFPLNDATVFRDRKGEIFYYMHQQMLARYDMERLSNNLIRTEEYRNLRSPIPEGYFSKLTIGNAGRNWGNRQDNTSLSDYRRKDRFEPFTLNDLETWRQRLMDGIHKGYLSDTSGNEIKLSDDVNILGGNKRGIDILGDAIEADRQLSVNDLFYGDLHNMGHVVFASAHDPDGYHNEELGVMGATQTAMRDPIFYRWHKFIDNLFQSYKLTQPPYPPAELVVEGIKVEKLEVRTGNDLFILRTFFDTKVVEASRGIDFGTSTPVDIKLTRLNHEEFEYRITVQNDNAKNKRVTVRIFLAPTCNEAGKEMNFIDQRSLWVEMDKFVQVLEPGENIIERKSTDSAITTTEERTFREMESGTENPPTSSEAFCGCGWPQHMLLPRGKDHGMRFQLFVLLSDHELDKVGEYIRPKGRCGKAVSYCGILDKKFPDRRAMGYPFDRRPLPTILTTADFIKEIPNSKMEDITIQFTNKLKTPIAELRRNF